MSYTISGFRIAKPIYVDTSPKRDEQGRFASKRVRYIPLRAPTWLEYSAIMGIIVLWLFGLTMHMYGPHKVMAAEPAPKHLIEAKTNRDVCLWYQQNSDNTDETMREFCKTYGVNL